MLNFLGKLFGVLRAPVDKVDRLQQMKERAEGTLTNTTEYVPGKDILIKSRRESVAVNRLARGEDLFEAVRQRGKAQANPLNADTIRRIYGR